MNAVTGILIVAKRLNNFLFKALAWGSNSVPGNICVRLKESQNGFPEILWETTTGSQESENLSLLLVLRVTQRVLRLLRQDSGTLILGSG